MKRNDEVYFNLLVYYVFSSKPGIGQGINILFVGDIVMNDSEYKGFSHLTMKMIKSENVNLIINIGDYDYWGQCVKEYKLKNNFYLDSIRGESLQLLSNSIVNCFKWQDGRRRSIRGW